MRVRMIIGEGVIAKLYYELLVKRCFDSILRVIFSQYLIVFAPGAHQKENIAKRTRLLVLDMNCCRQTWK